MQMIFICTENTVLSPLAEAAWHELTQNKQKQVKGLQVTSAGLAPRIGEPVTSQAVDMARGWGVDISGHRATQLDSDVARDVEWLIVMTEEQADAIISVYKVKDAHVMLLSSFCHDARFGKDIAFPKSGSYEAYETCAMHIRCGVQGLIRMICGE